MAMISSIINLIPSARYIIPAAQAASIISYQISRFFESSASLSNKVFTPISSPSELDKKISTLAKENLPWSLNFRHVAGHRDLLNDPCNADLERLVKVTIRKDLTIGQKIPIQMEDGSFALYRIHRKIATEGLVSYALKSENPKIPPLVVFRSTETNFLKEEAFSSMKNDVIVNIGEGGWKAAEKAFDELMQDPSFRSNGALVKVAGYSLGGAYAQYFIAKHHASVSHGIFYNDPSIDPKISEKFAKDIEEIPRTSPLVLQIFRTHGDPAHFFGGKHLGCEANHKNVSVQLLEIDIPGQLNFDIGLHAKRLFDTTDFNYTVEEHTNPDVLSKKLDNSKRSPISAFFESVRKVLSGCLFDVLSALEPIFNWIKKKIHSFLDNSSHRR